MLDQYIGVVFTFALAAIIVGVMVSASAVLGRGRRWAAKEQVFECGNPPSGTARGRFSVRFYLVAILFIVFDVEVVFMYPWSVVFRDFVEVFDPWSILLSMYSFVVLLLFGYAYAVKKGALDWKS